VLPFLFGVMVERFPQLSAADAGVGQIIFADVKRVAI